MRSRGISRFRAASRPPKDRFGAERATGRKSGPRHSGRPASLRASARVRAEERAVSGPSWAAWGLLVTLCWIGGVRVLRAARRNQGVVEWGFGVLLITS